MEEAPEQTGGEFTHQRHARGAAHQQDFIEVAHADPRIAQGPFDRRPQAFEQRRVELGELLLGDGFDPLAAVDAQGELGAVVLAQGFAHALGFAAQGVQHAAGGREVGGVALAVDEVFEQQGVEVFAAEEVVAGAGAHFHDPVEQLDDRHVEGAAAEVEDQERGFLVALVQAVGEGRGSRFVDQFVDVEPGQFTGDARGFALAVAEIRGHADHGVGDGVAVGAFDVFLEAFEHQCREFFGTERTVAQAHFSGATHVALEQ